VSDSVRASVIVCTYSDARRDLLERTITALLEQVTSQDEVVVVVDHNIRLAKELDEELAGVRVIENAERQGLSGGRNTGIRAVTGEFVVFLDDDAVPRPDWLEHLLAPFGDPAVSGVGGRAEPVWEAGDRPPWWPPELDWVVGCSFRGQAEGDVRNPIGCSMAFRSSVFAQVGDFAHDLGRVGTIPLGCEETELGLRVNSAGGRIVLAQRSVVDHFVPQHRASARYIVRRCYAEGISKAVVRRLAAHHDASGGSLGPEVRYLVDLGAGVVRSPVEAIRHRTPKALGRGVLLPVALAAAGVGFVRQQVADSLSTRR
jgi:GT2 family glycosyltransferase